MRVSLSFRRTWPAELVCGDNTELLLNGTEGVVVVVAPFFSVLVRIAAWPDSPLATSTVAVALCGLCACR